MRKATQQQIKEHNARLVLRTIYDQGRVSRAEVARLTGLARTTVSDTVADLLQDGLVAEVGVGPSAGGKPPILLSVVDDSLHMMGVDLSGHKFRGAIINLRGRVEYRHTIPFSGQRGVEAVQVVYQMIDHLLSLPYNPLLGIGIGSPGLMDARRGVVLQSVNLGWKDLPLRALLEERYDLPVYLVNDCQAAALGECTFGDERGLRNLVLINLNRGVGAGVILNRQIYLGDHCWAGEIGHVRAVEGGELCRCGHRGCLETVIGSRAVVRRAQEIARKDPHSTLYKFVSDPSEIDLDVLVQASAAGDRTVRSVVDEVGLHLGKAVAYLISILNVQHIVLAGSVSRFGDVLVESVQRHMRERTLPALAAKTQVQVTGLGTDIVCLGAAALLLSRELGIV